MYVGIDPGFSGGVGAIFPDGKVQSWHTPTWTRRWKTRGTTKSGRPKTASETDYSFLEMYRLIYQFKKLQDKGYRIAIGVEYQQGRPETAKQNTMKVGRSQGVWEALVGACGLPCEIITPSAWKPNYLEPAAEKERSVQECLKLYPEIKDEFKLKKDEAKAEGILIADYQMRKDLGIKFPRTRPKPVRRKKGEKKLPRRNRKARKSRALPS